MLSSLLLVILATWTCVHSLRSRIGPRLTSRIKLSSSLQDYALLFDCDGVIVETEELHRVAYNKAFEKFKLTLPGDIPVVWDPHYYDKLQNTVGGGKAKMRYFFTHDAASVCGMSENPDGGVWPICKNPYVSEPRSEEERVALIDRLQEAKTEFYCSIVENMATARPGVLELMDAAIASPRLKVGICSAATKAGFEQVVNSLVGKERLSQLDVVLAGDDVKNKKPDPEIYNRACEMLNMDKSRCIVVEDSVVGLKAAKAAGMKCIISYTSSTAKEDFKGLGADEVLADLQGYSLSDVMKHFEGASVEVSEIPVDASKTREVEAVTEKVATSEQSEFEASVIQLAESAAVEAAELAALRSTYSQLEDDVTEHVESADKEETVGSEHSQPEAVVAEHIESANKEEAEPVAEHSQPEAVVAEHVESVNKEEAEPVAEHSQPEAVVAELIVSPAAHPNHDESEPVVVDNIESTVDVIGSVPQVAEASEENISGDVGSAVTSSSIQEPAVVAGWGLGFMRSRKE